MATLKQRKADDWRHVLDNVRSNLVSGTITQLFQDDYFVLELIKLLYEENIEANVKVEILSVIEQWASEVLSSNSVDQAVGALLELFREIESSPASIPVAVQLLLTVTTLFIQHEDLLESELCCTYLTVLTSLVSKVNNVSNRRLRACGCQCLAEMESWRPGLLWRSREVLSQLAREEKTDVCQDYMMLQITLAVNADILEQEEGEHIKASSGKKAVERNPASRDNKDILSTVSLIMDNLLTLTPPGQLAVTCSVVQLLKTQKNVMSNVFKPLMLQCLPSMDPCVIYLMFYIQKEFQREVLSEREEALLLRRAVECANHPGNGVYTRLLVLEWLLSYLKKINQTSKLLALKSSLLPLVFDPLDVHIRKLCLLTHCAADVHQGLSSQLGYLTQVAETTGGMRVATALYHVLYLHLVHHASEAVHPHVLSITQKLFQDFPHLIPLIVDFLRAVKTYKPHSKFHSEIMTLLHSTVLSLPVSVLLGNYQFYLHVWSLSAQESLVIQQKPLRKMLELVQEAVSKAMDDWDLGCLILSICRVMLLHHHTDILYLRMGNLLSYMMQEYSDCDIRDNARLMYAMLTLTSDAKVKDIMAATVKDSLHLGQNIADFFPGSVVQTASAKIIHLDRSPIIWKREQLEVSFDMLDGTTEGIYLNSNQDGLADNWNEISGLTISLRCFLKTTISNESEFDHLLAVSFLTCPSDQVQVSQEVCLSYLSRGADQTICFELVPSVPDPFLLSARAIFGLDKSTYECDLMPVQFSLPDFLLPFPWHKFNIQDKQLFFKLNWQSYTEKSYDRRTGIESVKILKVSRETLHRAWAEAYLNNGDDADVDDYLFLLPPKYLLLFHVEAREAELVVHVASNHWPVLQYLDGYLDSLS